MRRMFTSPRSLGAACRRPMIHQSTVGRMARENEERAIDDIRVAVLGYGYWGPNLARNFVSADGARVVAICDERAESRELAASRHPNRSEEHTSELQSRENLVCR